MGRDLIGIKVNAIRVMESRKGLSGEATWKREMYKRSALHGVIKLFMYARHDIEYLESRSADDRIEAI